MGVKNITSKLIGVVLLLVIASSSVAYGYYGYQLDNTVTELEITFDKVELKGFRLLPSPEANLTLIYVANNVNNTEFRISLDGELYYGNHYITPLTVENARIRANGLSTFKMDVTITGSILNTIDPESKNEYSIQGELVATTRLFGLIPLSVTKPLSDYQ